jgi:galactokinase
LFDTGVRHELADGVYNTRRAECEAALRVLQLSEPGLAHLADWPVRRIPALRRLLDEPLRSRALHVVTETARTRAGADYLTRGRVRPFGRLLDASHESCRRRYECSAPELDTVVRAARRGGAWGARLTGAGWGGCVLVLVGSGERATVLREQAIVGAVNKAFMRAYDCEPSLRSVRPAAGARREPLELQ